MCEKALREHLAQLLQRPANFGALGLEHDLSAGKFGVYSKKIAFATVMPAFPLI